MKKERMKTGNNEPCPQDELTWEEKKILDIIGTKVIDGEEEGIDTMPAVHTPAIDYSTELEQPEVHPISTLIMEAIIMKLNSHRASTPWPAVLLIYELTCL